MGFNWFYEKWFGDLKFKRKPLREWGKIEKKLSNE